jgi:two-component system phosphate regulon sensor histidine kinase PhoR
MTTTLQRELAFLATLLFVMLLLGFIFDSVLLFVLLGLSVYIGWNLYQLNKLNIWLSKPSKQTPEAFGVWDDIYYQLYHLYKRQRKARKNLTTILGRFKKSTQALPYATIILNPFNEIEWFNPVAKQLFELHSRFDIGQRIDNLIRLPAFTKYLIKKDFTEPLKLSLNKKELLINITSYGDGQYLLSARDRTTVSKLDAMRRDFISNASHELRTPLTVISGYIEYLLHRADDDTQVPLQKIESQIIRMNKIIAELIELARLESSETVDQSVSVDTNKLVKEVYNEALTLDNDQHNITLDIDLDKYSENSHRLEAPDLHGSPGLYGSYEELRMAFINLLTNAIRYTPEGGDIRLFVSADDSCISVGVQDTGIGIDYGHITRLTERFYRVDEGRSREVGGTGLGLAIVKHVLDRHKAKLYVRSEPGKGSLFRCDFPLSHLEHHTVGEQVG